MPQAGDDELRLTVTLVDNASAGLRQLQGQLQSLGGGQSADNMTRMRRHIEETQRGLKPFLENIEKAGKGIIPEFASGMLRGASAMTAFTLSTVGVIGGLGAVTAGIVAANKAYGEMAEKMLEMGRLQTLTGINTAQQEKIVELYEQMGLKASDATRDMTGAASALADLNRVQSQIREQMLRGNMTPEQRANMERALVGLSRQDVPGYINMARELTKNVYENMVAQELKAGKSLEEARARGGAAAQDFATRLRVIAAPHLDRDVERATRDEVEMMNKRLENAKAWQDVTAKIEQSMGKIARHFLDMAASPLIAVFTKLNTEVERLLNYFEPKEGGKKEEPRWHFGITPKDALPQNRWLWERGHFPGQMTPNSGGRMELPGAPFDERFGKWPGPDDQKKIIEESVTKGTKQGILESQQGGLVQLASLGGPAASSGATTGAYTVAGGGRYRMAVPQMAGLGNLPGVQEPGGAAQPGAAPYGSHVGPGTGEGAGESPVGAIPSAGAATVKGSTFSSTTTASGRSAATTEGIAIPSGGRMGDMYRVTTPDGRSFTAPLIDRGPAKWTGRGVDISGPLAARMGYGKDFPTDAEFKVAPIGAAGDPTVPSDVLARAREVALKGGPGAVERFMAQQGYPKHGNWCGEFAASVVKSAGGMPPRNPEIASNWRNYGSLVRGAPAPGDIAVADRGVPTGATGSHVTIVESYNPKTGTFVGLGGNQGRGFESTFQAGGYQFRRADVDRSMNAQQLNATGKLTVDVNAPKGTRVGAEGSGLFKSIEVNRQTQMDPAAASSNMEE